MHQIVPSIPTLESGNIHDAEISPPSDSDALAEGFCELAELVSDTQCREGMQPDFQSITVESVESFAKIVKADTSGFFCLERSYISYRRRFGRMLDVSFTITRNAENEYVVKKMAAFYQIDVN